ncbi:uncharacterized protein LOC128735773 [Sabethes cyaneus]|uniref:uncharacterized protein LOC128735773 n=1 Tax=Sabethes cyaneus TaxID=53552 RepID=UPI00237E17CC|nr:uncharacterized protein LOC128735773 [Sabethes cyaneus]
MDILEGLKRYRLFQPAVDDAEVIYRNAVVRIDSHNAFMGINMFRKKINFCNFPFLWGIFTLFFFTYLMIETAYWYRQEIEKVLMTVTTFGFSIQMSSKIYTFILTRKRILEVNQMNLDYFQLDVVKSTSVKKALQRSSSLTHILVTISLFTYHILAGIVATGPMVLGLATSNKLLPLGVEVLHSDSWIAYFVNYLMQFNLCYYGAFLTTTSEAAYILFVLTATGHIDAIIGLLDELQDMTKKRVDEAKVSEQLFKVLQIHQYHQHYMRKIVDLFQVYFLLAIASLYSCVTISLASFVLINWYIGMVVVFFASFQIFFMCFLGTHLQMKNDQLMTVVGSFAWFALPVRDQKQAILFLAATQRPISPTAVLGILNVETFLKIYKSVYSMLMVLLRVKV